MGRTHLLVLIVMSMSFAPVAALADKDATAAKNAKDAITAAQPQLTGIQPQSASDGTKSAGDACSKALEAGRQACMESTSPFMQEILQMIPVVMAMVSGSTNSQKCQAMKDALGKMGQNQSSFNKACDQAKTECTNKCAQGSSTVSSLQSSCDSNPTTAAKCHAALTANQTAISQGVSGCADLQSNKDAGDANLGNLMQGLGNAAQCKDDSTDCTANPNATGCTKTVDCNDPDTAKTNPTCICQLSPRSPGCGGSTSYTTTDPSTTTGSKGGDLTTTPTVGAPDAGAPADMTASPAGSGLPGSFGDGGGGSLSAAAADGAKPGAAKAKADAPSGDGGAGGMGRGGAVGDPYGKYAEYLPKKNDSRAPSSKPVDQQVSGSNGLTNWEKVNQRYRDNKPSLISISMGK